MTTEIYYGVNDLVIEGDLVQVVNNGLGPMYKPFVRSLENYLYFTFHDLYGLLVSEKENLATKIDVKPLIQPITHYVNSTVRGSSSCGRGRNQMMTYGRECSNVGNFFGGKF